MPLWRYFQIVRCPDCLLGIAFVARFRPCPGAGFFLAGGASGLPREDERVTIRAMLPPLYKFRAVDDYTLDSLRNGYLYFSNPTTFNDPFELRAYLTVFDDTPTLRRVLMDSLERLRPDLSYLERRKRAPHLVSDPKVRDALLSFRYFPEDYLKTVIIYSASARRDCLLLWAHYASNHRGICIELDCNRDRRMRQARPVEYLDSYPAVDYFDPDNDAKYRKVILRKSPDWSYEKEYRAVFHEDSGKAKVAVSPSTFVSITFGARITDEDRAAVIDATRAKLSHVRFEQARLAERTYSLEFGPFEVETGGI